MKKTITGKGLIESDILTAFFAVMLMVFLMVSALSNVVAKDTQARNLEYLKIKSMLYADLLVKNSDENSPEKGIAFFNQEKNRVEENVLSIESAEKINEKNLPEHIKAVIIQGKTTDIKIGKKQENCFEARRFALEEKIKEKLVVFVFACS